jgi:hypothetical protein
MVLNQTSGGPRQLVQLDLAGDGNTAPLVDEVGASRPAISEDREHVAYLVGPGDGTGPAVPRLIRPAGTRDRPLLQESARASCPLAARPAWKSDSGHLALVCFDADKQPLGVMTTDLEGSEITKVVDWKWADGAPSWGGDGKIYFVSRGHDGKPDQVLVVGEGGGEPTHATDGTAYESSPHWGKPGLLYLESSARRVPGDIYLQDGEGRTQLTRTGDAQAPTWAPDFDAVAWQAPSKEHKSVLAVWVAEFTSAEHGGPRLGTPQEVPMGGKAGPPAWGSF